MLRCAPVEFDNKIDVAVFGVEIATRRRAEQIQPSHLEATAQRSQFLLVQLDFADHYGSATRPLFPLSIRLIIERIQYLTRCGSRCRSPHRRGARMNASGSLGSRTSPTYPRFRRLAAIGASSPASPRIPVLRPYSEPHHRHCPLIVRAPTAAPSQPLANIRGSRSDTPRFNIERGR